MKLFFIGFFFLIQISVSAQEVNYIDTPLNKVLTDLEKRFEVRFSYNTAFIKAVKITFSIKQLSFQDIISKIQKDYKVTFNKIDERYFTVETIDLLTVCGYLRDGIDGLVIERASIRNQKNTVGTVSDKNGFFSIENQKITDTLFISFIGYKTIVLPVAKTQGKRCNTYTFLSESYNLNEVVIQEYLAAGVVKTNDGAVKINPNSLDILAGLSEPDILQNIQLLPGIESPSETASGLYIRGGTPDQNLILWDGIKMYNSDHFFGMLSAFNPYITKDIKIYRSGAKPRYGDRISGIIDINTQDNLPKKMQGGLGINMTHGDVYLKTPIAKKYGFLFSARRSLPDIIPSPTFDKFAQRIFQNTRITENERNFNPDFSEETGRFYFTDFNFKFISEVSKKDKLTLAGLYTKNKLNYGFNIPQLDRGSKDKLSIENKGLNVNWSRKWSEKTSSIVEGYYSNYDFSYTGKNSLLVETQTVFKENNINELGFNFHSEVLLNKVFTLSTGYQFFLNKVEFLLKDIDFTGQDIQNSPTHSIYTSLNYSKPNSWYVDLGLRASYYHLSNSVFIEPRIYAERILGDHFRLKGSAEIRNQAVSQIIEFITLDFGLENQVWALADGDRVPLLRSNQFTTGFLFNKDGWKIDVDFYLKFIDGFTSLTKGFESSSTSTSFSEGDSTVKGIDILLKKKINRYSTWLGYTYSDNVFAFEDLNQGNSFRGNNNIMHSITWSHFYNLHNFQFSLGWKYRSNIPYTNALGLIKNNNEYTINYASINAGTLPDYHRLDFSVSYDFKLSKKENSTRAKSGFSLLNVYGKKNLLNKSFSIVEILDDQNNVDVRLRELDKFSLGTTLNVFFRLNFN